MASLSPSQKLLRRHSPWRLAFKIGGAVLLGLVAVAIRMWMIEGVRLPDRALVPDYPAGKWMWVCKADRCIDQIQASTPVLFQTTAGQRLMRIVVGGPGEKVTGDMNGKISAPGFQRKIRDDSWFFDKISLQVPKRGDSLVFSKLNPAELDLALRLYREQKPKHKLRVEASLWIDNRLVPLEKAAIAQIHGIPVKSKEIGSMSWQELKLIEMQVLRNEHGSSQVEIRRTVSRKSKPVLGFKVKEDCYFALCLRAKDCVDSRELGYIPRNRILGVALTSKP